jgi:xanthine dehydrogenase FAD-binding subunit
MPTIKHYLAPASLPELLQLAAEHRATILAGGTDLLPRWQRGAGPAPAAVVSLRGLADLSGVTRTGAEVRVGAATPLSAIASHPIIAAAAPVLALAASRVACPQVRNRATIGGNLCNASPAADTAIPLLLLDAVLDLACFAPGGLTAREVPLTDFFRGPGATVLRPGDLLTQIRFNALPEGAFAAWDKFGTRPAMEIAVASLGVALRFEGHTVTHARVAYGSVAPVPLRGRGAEAQLVGKPLAGDTSARCVAAARAEISPITDVRASADYRREVVGVLLRRMLERAQRLREN